MPAQNGSKKSSLTHYVVTLIADTISERALQEVTNALTTHHFNVSSTKLLSQGDFGCVEIMVSREVPKSGAQSFEKIKEELLTIARTLNVDVALQSESHYRRAKRLVVFDMDSTLIQGEVIDELAREKGVYDQVAAITHDAMNGK